MSKFSKIYSTTALCLTLSTPAAFADVTNGEVWDNWQGYMNGMGYSITANEAASGNVLTVTDVKMTVITNESGEDLSAILPQMIFTEQGDGSVKIALPPLSEIILDLSLETGEKIDAVIGYAQDGLDMTVTGENGTFNYVYTANGIDLSLGSLLVDGDKVGADIAKVSIGLKDILGNSTITAGEMRNYAQSLSASTLTYNVAFSDPDTGTTLKADGSLESLKTSSDSVFANQAVAMQDISEMLASGFTAAGVLTYGGGKTDVAFNGPDGAGTLNTSSTGGAVDFSFGTDGIEYSINQTGLAINALVPNVPIPIALNMEQSKFNLAMPIQKSDEEQDFAFGLTLGDFTVSDMLWGIFDPTAQLPRNPATIAFDLTGKAKVLFDFLDADQAAALESSGAVPGELNALTLNNLVVDAVGARLTGTGDFTFDNSDLASFNGMPRPVGAVDLKLVGGNGLLDRLVAMQLLPQDLTMGARIMMGLFAVAGPEPDTLTSKIEINEAGHILANGQRIQ